MASKTERVLVFYKTLLNSLDLCVDDEGLITFAPPGAVDKKNKPVFQDAMVEGKRWCLPTHDILDASPWESHIAFHPFSENFVNEESETLTKLKAAINFKLGVTVGKLMLYLTEFAADPSRHGKVSARASKYLKLVPNLKTVSTERMESIVARSTSHADRRFVNLYLKKGGSLEGVAYGYAAMVTFPFRQELEGAEPKVFGVDISQKDQASFKALFDYILPENDELATYSAGSSSHTAPRFEALLKAYLRVAEGINAIVEHHRKILPTFDELHINTDWMEELGHFRALADVIPPLPGNIGEAIKDRKTDQAAAIKSPAYRLFGQDKPSSTRREEPTRTQPAERAERQVANPVAPVAAAAVEDPIDDSHLSFRQRIEMQRKREDEQTRLNAQNRGYGNNYGAATDTGYGNRNYQPAEPNVPGWMHAGSTSMTVAGDDPRNLPENERFRGGYQGGRPATAFAERMSRRASLGGGHGGGYIHSGRGGGSFSL